ncbi:hypothetical protein CR513_59005, partial [Mucuna pruriens]
MNLVLAVTTLVEQGEFEERANIGALGSECDEDGDISGVIFGVLAVGVKVYGPLVTSHRESLAGYVFSDADSLRQRVTLDNELVRTVHRLRHRPRTRPRRQDAPTRRRRVVHLTRDSQLDLRAQTMYDFLGKRDIFPESEGIWICAR